MSTKPTLANARWADQVGANLTSPSSGLRDTGFQPATPANSGYVNTLLHELYLWAEYVNDGEWDGPIEIDGDLEVTGTTTLADAEIDTLTVTSQLFHGERAKLYSAGYCQPFPGSSANLSSPGQLDLDDSTQYVTLPIDVGDAEHIRLWTVYLNKNSASGTVIAELVEQSADGSQVQLGPTISNSAASPGAITLTSGVVDYDVSDSSKSYFLRVAGGGTVTGAVGDKICSYLVGYTRPAP